MIGVAIRVMETKRYLEALERILSDRYSQNEYHIGGYQEDAVCMQFDKYGWIVYNAERGNHYDEIHCDTVLNACLVFIRKMTHSVEDISEMEATLIRMVVNGE